MIVIPSCAATPVNMPGPAHNVDPGDTLRYNRGHCLGCDKPRASWWILLACCVLQCWAGAARAQENKQDPGMIDSLHYQASQRLSDFIGQIDEFFGGEEESARVNESWARVRLDSRYDEEEGSEVKGNIKLKLVLPNAKKRFRLLLSTDQDDAGSGPDSTANTAGETDSNVSLALRFVRKARTNGGVKFDLGVRSRDSKSQTFVRLGAFYREPLNDIWTGTITNNAFYYYSSGFVDKLAFKFERVFGRSQKNIFQSSTLISWIEGQRGAVVDQVAGVYRAYDNKSSIAFELKSGLVTSPDTGAKRFQGGQVRVRYRRSIWRPWFYLEFWPSISWPVEYGYKGIYGGLFRVEALIGQHDR